MGWIIDSSQPEQGAIGATLDIQRSQQMEALEQYQIQQQTRMNARRLPNQVFRQSKNNLCLPLYILVCPYLACMAEVCWVDGWISKAKGLW